MITFKSAAVFLLLCLETRGQFFNLFNFQPQRPIVPQNNAFNPFFQQQRIMVPAITTTTEIPIELVPNPDLEKGNWPLPDPRSWPVGPDWNDPRNNWKEQKGWGGNETTSTTKIVKKTQN